MNYREFGKTGKRVSVLGFGIMRLPYTESESSVVDRNKACEMIEYAVENGVNYFDTAQNYLNGESEIVLGDTIHSYRDKIHIATKVGIWHVNEGIRDVEQLLNGQLKRLKSDYIDFYMIHALTDDRWKRFMEIGIIDFFERKKREGIIRHYGFSYHGTPFFFKTILDEYDWEFIQLQYNYVDRNMQAGESGLVYAEQKGVGTVIMEPLRGGQLVRDVHERIRKPLTEANPSKTMAQWGLEYLWNRSDVDIVLSGMNHINQVKENIRLASQAHIGMLKIEEREALEKAGEIYKTLIKVPCTLCRYCRNCPQKVDIPRIMEVYNNAATMDYMNAKHWYEGIKNRSLGCIKCGKCEEVCPQGIKISQVLEEAERYFQ